MITGRGGYQVAHRLAIKRRQSLIPYPDQSLKALHQTRKRRQKKSKEDSNGIMENETNSNNKILSSVNNRIKSETEGIENDNKELKPKFERKKIKKWKRKC